LNPDPDPACQGEDPRSGSGSGSRVLMTKNTEVKNTAENFFYHSLIKNCNYISLGLYKERPSYKRSLQPSNENIQQFKK
jgi:hypothetical protein